jgi:hypothetical protein
MPHCRVNIIVLVSRNRYVGPLPVNQAWLKFCGDFPQGRIGEEGFWREASHTGRCEGAALLGYAV